jgi:hypothetical protein
MPAKIFVSYRRDDSASSAARIRDRLARVFGEANVFMDVDQILPGQRFEEELDKAVTQCDVLLAVIGPRWLELLSARQYTEDRDFVCEEISTALTYGIVVIPVLVEKAALPTKNKLPEDIRGLLLHQKHEVTHERFGRDVEDLITAIRVGRKALWASRRERTNEMLGRRPNHFVRDVVVILGLLSLISFAVLYFWRDVVGPF